MRGRQTVIVSRFTISIPGFPSPGRHLLYNTRSQAEVVVDDELAEAVRGLPQTPRSEKTSAALGQLARMGFLVCSPEEDARALEAFFDRARRDDSVLRPTVLTTYACNFACRYCVEDGLLTALAMDEDMARRAVDYIEEKFVEYRSREISLTFYGGEPLLNMRAVRAVAARLKRYTSERGVPFGFGLCTNGALLSEEVVRELAPLGLTGAKITLDGPREVHDRNRPFRSGAGSFDVLLANIRAAADLTRISIEINFDEPNAAQVPALLDQLAAEGLAVKIERVVFSPISPTPKDRLAARPGSEVPCRILSPESARLFIWLQEQALERGFEVGTGVAAHMCEMLMKRSSFIIDPRGELYRCGGLAGRAEFSAGRIDGTGTDAFLGRELWRRCGDCALVPVCGDGCPFGAYVRYGDPLRLVCEKESMEYVVRERLMQAYRRKKARAASGAAVR
jgi:uncharacterized protein